METKNMNDQELENVEGGEYRVVNTGDERPAAIRTYPGLNAPVIATLTNGTTANTTGRFTYADGRNWAEIAIAEYFPTRGPLTKLWQTSSVLSAEKERKGPAEEALQAYTGHMRDILKKTGLLK